jgi:hypothetical protein
LISRACSASPHSSRNAPTKGVHIERINYLNRPKLSEPEMVAQIVDQGSMENSGKTSAQFNTTAFNVSPFYTAEFRLPLLQS